MSLLPIDTVLSALRLRRPVDVAVAVVVAHADDETIGAGASLHLFRRLSLVYVTDGAPQNMRDARAAGFPTAEAYAEARWRELGSALYCGGVLSRRRVPPGQRLPLSVVGARPGQILAGAFKATPANSGGGSDFSAAASQVFPDALTSGDEQQTRASSLPIPDQSAAYRLNWLAAELRVLLQDVAVVLTHPYEGGHPDHDSVAFAVQQTGLPRIEMAGYHAAPEGGIRVGRFLQEDGTTDVPLNAVERARREAMLDCFVTQKATLASFRHAQSERFRSAPQYDFTRPPAERVYYDDFDWSMNSKHWCALAAEALRCAES